MIDERVLIEMMEGYRATTMESLVALGERRAINEVIKVANQLAKNNGWTACSEKLPEENGRYIVWYHHWSDGKYLPKYDDAEVRVLHFTKEVGWTYPRYCDAKAANDAHYEVVAWQPLPEPYQPKEAGNEVSEMQ